jgi:CMP/dCMP kinase
LMELYDVKKSKARDIMIKTDKKRSSYYNYYSNKKWGDVNSYHLCINRSILGIDGTVNLLRDFANAKVAAKK